MLKLSVVTTMYNSAQYLPKCINSLLDQDIALDEYEIILVNDGSPDDSKAIADDYARQFGNIKVLSHANKGLAGARNTGLSAAKGKYLRFVDPDDYVEPNTFSSLLEQMEKENLDMLRFDYRMVNESYCIVDKPKGVKWIDYSSCIMDGESFLYDRLGFGCFVWTFVYRLSFLQETGIPFVEGAYFDDTNWLPKVLRRAKSVNSTSKVAYYYYQRQGSLLNTVSEASRKAKEKGQIQLIGNLKTNYDQETSQKVRQWYRSMISSCAFSMLMSSPADKWNDTLVKMKRMNLLPFRIHKTTPKVRLKLMIVNAFPHVYGFVRRLRKKI
ncbi:MAG: glycosyltransferase [Bacteroidales bacterium]|nr:glycosyltransferase [Bacteroidales bacterium]